MCSSTSERSQARKSTTSINRHRPVKHEVETWRVVDNWPQRVPVTQAEIDVFEAWFGDLFDEFLDRFEPLKFLARHHPME
jgi:hypothetical protein